MPKITLPPDGIPPIPPAGEHGVGIKGSFILYKWRGGIYARSWPKKRTAKQRAAMREQNDQFKAYVYCCKVTEASFQVAAAEMSKGTTLYPRDVQIMTMASTAYGPIDVNDIIGADDPSTPPNENPNEPKDTTIRLFPMSQVLNVSSWLDALGYKQGNILVRQEEFWYSLEAGNHNDVLTIDPITGMPAWAEMTPPEASSAYVAWPASTGTISVDTSFHATKGLYFTLAKDIYVSGIHLPLDAYPSGTFVGTIAELDTSHPTYIEVISSTQTPAQSCQSFGVGQTLLLRFGSTQHLISGKTYFIGASITSGGGTTALYAYKYATGGIPQTIPAAMIGRAYWDKTSLAPADTTTLISKTKDLLSFGIEWKDAA